jgi:hypothetical protein
MQPKFSSLIVAIDKPQVDLVDAQKYIKAEIDDAGFAQAFEKNRQDFFERMAELLGQAKILSNAALLSRSGCKASPSRQSKDLFAPI